ncbi:GNAT family N-acetyltransferase [Streptomyces sp. NPDC017979]|uniref:GNAT family N-acetyltransferase n=1 Tax=unclassified Streptomyces TaxID=2593676 RepID=UPI0037A67A8D
MNVTMDAADADDFHRVLADHHRYWGERDMRSLHLLAMVQEFGPTCLVARADGAVVGYVFGFTTPAATGYVHLVATRDDARGVGLGRRLYEAFARAAQAQGATALKAITSPANTGSIAFHHSLGFASSTVPDYDGRGRTMVVFTRPLPLVD